LALLQEEVSGQRDLAHTPSLLFSKIPRTAMPLPPPPSKNDKAVPQVDNAAAPALDSKLFVVKAYRKAMGLCYKCGLKWSRDHKCAPHDIWESLSVDNCSSPMEPIQAHPDQLFLALSKSAVSGAPAPRTIQFRGTLEGIPLIILIDSGSSSSFVNDKIVQQLSSQIVSTKPTTVHVAGGSILLSQGILKNVTWCIDNHSFQFDLKILPFTHFDLMIGIDWLE
jgi:hypothetical protein